MGDYDGERWEKAKGRAKRVARAAREAGVGAAKRYAKGQVEVAKVLVRHPEILAGKIDPSVVAELMSTGAVMTPAEGVRAIKDFAARYKAGSPETAAAAGLEGFGGMFERSYRGY